MIIVRLLNRGIGKLLGRGIEIISVCLLLLGVSSTPVSGQSIPSQSGLQEIIKSRTYPTDYFGSPLNIPHQASGTFGELRSTHFHAGDDYRTQQRVGLPLFAIAEGYVSRIRVQIGGGGNSIYITHPNGFTSVYLHMHEFADPLAQRVIEEQYAQQRFDVDIPLQPDEFPLEKGERIGLAGNSGSSQGPHLHFEIRDTKTQDPINPQLFGLHFPDKLPPLIQGITIYDLGGHPFNEHTPRRHFKTNMPSRGTYQLTGQQTPISVNGRFGVGIQTVDRHDGTTFNNGVYSIELFLDDQPISTVVFERLSYAWSSAIHSYIDYPFYVDSKTRVQKSFRDPNSPVELFHYLEGDGTLNLDAIDGDRAQPRKITYRVRDIHGNTSTISFPVRHDGSYAPARVRETGTVLFRFDRDNRFASDNIYVSMPKDALYNHLYFNYSQGARPEGGYSLIQHVHNNRIPLFKSYELKIRPDASLPPRLQPKALIVDDKGASHGGIYKDGFVVTNTRSFGSFHVRVDTIPPRIQAVNITPGKNIAGQSRINFRISDELSGIDSFDAYLNGEWILMEYDPKNRALWHTLSRDLHKGTHQFRLEVRDRKGNQQIYETHFLR